jgi:hypothetical protein
MRQKKKEISQTGFKIHFSNYEGKYNMLDFIKVKNYI